MYDFDKFLEEKEERKKKEAVDTPTQQKKKPVAISVFSSRLEQIHCHDEGASRATEERNGDCVREVCICNPTHALEIVSKNARRRMPCMKEKRSS